LTSNKISSLPTEIGNLKSLTHLYIGENNLFSIPPHIGMMSNLKELYINDNTDLQVAHYSMAPLVARPAQGRHGDSNTKII